MHLQIHAVSERQTGSWVVDGLVCYLDAKRPKRMNFWVSKVMLSCKDVSTLNRVVEVLFLLLGMRFHCNPSMMSHLQI
jgi:hypothetical protein